MDIIVTNTKCKLIGNPVEMEEVAKTFRVKAKGYFFSPAWKKRQWDGYINYVTHAGYFEAGLLPRIVKYLKVEGVKIKLIDNRQHLQHDETITELGGLTLRPYQLASINAVLNHKIMGIPFSRCILKEATNAGKNIISAAIFSSYPEGTVFFFLIHRQFIQNQSIKEITELLGANQVGMIDSKRFVIKQFNICMVQSLCSKIKDPRVKAALAKADGVIVDECHRASSKQYETVLRELYNCPIKIGVSGTPLHHKDPNDRIKILSQFGDVIHEINNKELVEQGYSTEPIIKIILGETRYKINGDYMGEYNKVITNNKSRTKKVWKRVARQIAKGRVPLMILCKYVAHADNVLNQVPKEIKERFRIAVIHNKVRNGAHVLEDFKTGKIDILIATHLIAEGQNMPLIRYAINAGGSDSVTLILQWLGRMLRVHKSKKKVYVEDIYDTGIYLKRHSKHRTKFYKETGFKVIETYKITAKRKAIKIY